MTRDVYPAGFDTLENSYTWSFTTAVDEGYAYFKQDSAYDVGLNINRLAPIYFDTNQLIDIALLGQGPDSLYILLNQGDGVFDYLASYTMGPDPWDLAAADFNGDGLMDVATALRNSSNISVRINNGEADFNPRAEYGISTYKPKSLVAFDIEGDGDIDIAAAGEDSLVTILKNSGSGIFSVDSDRCFFANILNTRRIDAADLNGDGVVDYKDLAILGANYEKS